MTARDNADDAMSLYPKTAGSTFPLTRPDGSPLQPDDGHMIYDDAPTAACVCGEHQSGSFPDWSGGTLHRTDGPCYQVVAEPPAEHVATLVARSPGKVVSMICSCGESIVGDLLPFAGVTRLMLEHLNGGKADQDTVMQDLLRRSYGG